MQVIHSLEAVIRHAGENGSKSLRSVCVRGRRGSVTRTWSVERIMNRGLLEVLCISSIVYLTRSS